MAEIKINPVSKLAGPGSSATYDVQIKNGDASTVRVHPCKSAPQYKVGFAGKGLEAPVGKEALKLTIDIPDKTSIA
jgi:hypothetical protein